MTTPSNACRRSRSPSITFTCTTTVSPAPNSGTSRFICSASSSLIMLLIVVHPLVSRVSFGVFSRSFSLPDVFVQQRLLFVRQLDRIEQVRAPLPGPPERLHQPPAADLRVVPVQQHLRHPATVDLLRS